MATMTCEEIFSLHASDTENSDLYDAYRNVPLDSRDEMHKNNTPLHTACYFADITAVGILLERGVDTNARNDDGDTPLCVMAKRNSCPNDTLYADISGLLLYEGAKVTRSGKNTTALIEAVRNRHFLMADVLLMSGNRIDSTDWNGDNVLHAICDSAGYIANNIKSNIRELEGAINKVMAFAKLEKKEVTLELAEQALKDIISPDEKKVITPDYIISMVAEHFDVTVDDLCGNKRNSKIVTPRQIAMYLCREIISTPLKSIGKCLGNRDHTTIMHGIDKIEKEINNDENLKNTIETLKKKINPQG